MSALMAEQEKNEGIQLAVPGLGDRLRAARTACNLDLAKLAARIHLTVDMVNALERDDYAEMPARVFVRGYVRNYARAVNLPPESVLAQFDRLWPDEENRVQLHESPGLAADIPARRGWPRLVTWLVVLAVIGLPLIWWQGYLDQYLKNWKGGSTQTTEPSASLSTETASPAPQSVPSTAGLAPLLPARSDTTSGQSGALLPLPAAPAATQPASVAASPAEAGNAAATKGVSAATGSMSERSGGVSGALLPLPAPKAEPAMAQIAPSVQEPAAAVEQVVDALPQVTLRFRRNSWVDVRDSTRSFKLVGIMRSGTQKTLGGKPPYNVVLGNASAVEVRVDGKPYDLKRHMRGNVARFTLTP